MATYTIDGLSVSCYGAGNGTVLDTISLIYPPAGSQDQVWVEILDKNLVSQGVIQFATLTATLYYNQVGSWSMVVPYSDFLWNMLQGGDFFANVNWRGLFSFGGKVEQPGYQDSIPGSTGGAGSLSGPFISLSGADYLGLLANRICYPAPGSAWGSQTAGASDAVSAMKLESAIKHYINNNVGFFALSSRQLTLMDVATDQGRGPNVTYAVKFIQGGPSINLMDVIRAMIAQSNTQMGVQVLRNQSAHRLTFDCYVPRNLAGLAWFSRDLGNLTAVNFYITDPTCTDALVWGSGSFVSRVATARTSWNVTEQFIDDSQETDANNLATAAQTALLTGAAGPNMSATVTDTPFLSFGRDYYLGDIVSLEVRPGAVYSDVVSSVTLTADPAQTPMYSVVPAIGNSSNATATDQTAIGQLLQRIRTLERKLASK
jgi:hypothetical protein